MATLLYHFSKCSDRTLTYKEPDISLDLFIFIAKSILAHIKKIQECIKMNCLFSWNWNKCLKSCFQPLEEPATWYLAAKTSYHLEVYFGRRQFFAQKKLTPTNLKTVHPQASAALLWKLRRFGICSEIFIIYQFIIWDNIIVNWVISLIDRRLSNGSSNLYG